MFLTILCYLFLLSLVVFLSIKLANLVDLLDKKTEVSGAFIGGVLLAAVTSLPELFTAISSITIVNDVELVIGNILGSNIFNLMILGLYSFLFWKNYYDSKISSWYLVSLGGLFAIYGLSAYALFAPVNLQPMFGSINAISILIFCLYIILIWKQPKSSEKKEIVVKSKLTVKQIIFLFIGCSLLLIFASIGITCFTDLITKEISWLGGTIAGAVLLGVATSLPEVISTFHLFRIGNLDSGYGNMIGSCTFNFLILALADFISWEMWNGSLINERGIYISNLDSKQFLLYGFINLSVILLLLIFKKHSIFIKTKKSTIGVTLSLALISIISYLFVFIF